MNAELTRIALLEEWMRGKEGEDCEFKKAEGSYHFEELGKYCAALANGGGGRVILGLIERGSGRTYLLARRYYEFVGQKGVYTRKKGLDRKQNLALLLKHVEESKSTGCKLEELRQVLSALPTSQVQSLLRTLQRTGAIHSVGRTNQGRWYPGPG